MAGFNFDESNDFFNKLKVSEETQQLIKSACYDCHSNETVFPKYAYMQPVGWLLKDHIDDGRKHLNFSEWNTYEKKKKELDQLEHVERPRVSNDIAEARDKGDLSENAE